MLWTPKKGKLLRQSNLGSVGSATLGTTATTHASVPSTKGTPVELISATLFDVYRVRIIAANHAVVATTSECAIDILGGAATEEVLIANLLAGFAGVPAAAGKGAKVWEFPLYIPAGTRLAAQAAGIRAAAGVDVGIMLFGGDGYPPWRVGSKVTTYGMGTVPNGTPITPGINGAEGNWTQVTVGTSEDHFAVVPSLQYTNDVSIKNAVLSLDIGVGAATESEIGGPYTYESDSSENMCGPHHCEPAYHDIPSGTRLVARVSNNTTNDGGYNTVLHCLS